MNNIFLIILSIGSLIGVGLLGFTAMGDNSMMDGWDWDNGHHGMMNGDHHHNEGYEHHEECEEYMEEHCEYDNLEDCEAYSEECEEHDEEYCEHHEEDNVNIKTIFNSLFDSNKIVRV